MEKRLSCRDVGVDCDFVACGKTEEEIFQKAAVHAKADHSMSEIPKELYGTMARRVQRFGRFNTADSIGRGPPETGFRRPFLMGNPARPRVLRYPETPRKGIGLKRPRRPF